MQRSRLLPILLHVWGAHAQGHSECREVHTRTLAQPQMKDGHPVWSLAKPASLHSVELGVKKKIPEWRRQVRSIRRDG